jgi:hypothetical protein
LFTLSLEGLRPSYPGVSFIAKLKTRRERIGFRVADHDEHDLVGGRLTSDCFVDGATFERDTQDRGR